MTEFQRVAVKVGIIAQLADDNALSEFIVAAVARHKFKFRHAGDQLVVSDHFVRLNTVKTGHCTNCFTTEVHERGGTSGRTSSPFSVMRGIAKI